MKALAAALRIKLYAEMSLRSRRASRIQCVLFFFIIKFTYNARSDWMKQRALSEIRKRVDDIKLAFKFLLLNFDCLILRRSRSFATFVMRSLPSLSDVQLRERSFREFFSVNYYMYNSV